LANSADTDGDICMRCHVAGRVQGVFFRASTRQQARTLGLTGHARNLADGGVEVLVCGDPAAVRELMTWLRVGPDLAQVSTVTCEPTPYVKLSGFTIG